MPEVTQEVSGRGECWRTLPCSVEWAHQHHGRAVASVELCPHIRCLAGFPGRNQPPVSHHCAPLHVRPLEYITQLCCSMAYFTDFLCHLLFPSLCRRDNLNDTAPLSLYPLFSLKTMRINKQKHWLEQKRLKAWHLFYHLQLRTDILW